MARSVAPGFRWMGWQFVAHALHVAWGKDGEEGSRTIGPGEFWISSAGTPYIMTAGPEGVTYIETWPEPMAKLETYWHDAGWVHR